jgi:riboflavin synthase
MFTGLIEAVGSVSGLEPTPSGYRLGIRAPFAADVTVGESLAVNGVCLTVVARAAGELDFELGPETLARTALGRLAAGERVNLERPLRFGGALGGHLVLGHVDAVATVTAVSRVESTARVRIALGDRSLAPLLIPQGSVAVDGVSLTVAGLDGTAFEVMLIPHTLAATTLGALVTGQAVNIETDVIGKYVVRSLALRGTS